MADTRSALDLWSDDELIEQTQVVADGDPSGESGARWELVEALRARDTPRVFEAAANWCTDEQAATRALGADVLGQLGVPDASGRWPFGDRAMALLISMLADPQPAVLQSAIVALGHLTSGATDDPGWDPALLRGPAAHVDGEVREAVAWALGSAHCDGSAVAVEIMLGLVRDQESRVRDWATFGLGQSSVDTPAVRSALAERLDDADEEVRLEALTGLARRKDERVLPLIDKALASQQVPGLIIEAAGEFGWPGFAPALRALAEASPGDEMIVEALQRCRGAVE